ncbi:MAG: alternative ribosome rescue aminoacyl-tRNA hydrolase ArfB [Planctomycetia bacterium]|nr:alternative ribosome rescue aminoacyl-tRNA hydrolase ArfB [Planctomycetia bacterium]
MTAGQMELANGFALPEGELIFTFVRSSGPGGQNVNKVSSKAVLRWDMRASASIPDAAKARFAKLYPFCVTSEGKVILTCQKSRDALKNRNYCQENLRVKLVAALQEPKKRIPTRPTKGSIKRRLENKARQSEKKQSRGLRFE